MSAVLFGRGSMTQTGSRQRAEATDNAIKTLRAELAAVSGLTTQIRILEARLMATERKVATLEADLAKANAAIAATQATSTAGGSTA